MIKKIEKLGFEAELFGEIWQIGGEKALHRFISLALQNINTQYHHLQKACAALDYAEIEGAAHSLRGSALNIGHKKLALLAEKYELLAENKLDEASGAYEALLPQMHKIQALSDLMETEYGDDARQ